MDIIFDIRPMLEKNRSGVSIYAARLLDALARQGTHRYRLFCNTHGRPLPDDIPRESDRIAHRFSSYPNRLLNLAITILNRPRIESLAGSADLVYLPNLNFIATKLPYVTTVHDLSFVRYPRFFSAKQRLWHRMVDPGPLIRKAAAVIAVSEHTKIDLSETFGIDPEKVAVVHPAVGPEFMPCSDDKIRRIRTGYGLEKPFFLYLGALEPRKNVRGIIAAFDLLDLDMDLVIAGGKGWLFEDIFRAAAIAKRGERIRFLDYVAEEDKPALYSAADVFVYPSFYEGFGMPPLEAMACGTPVVTSHATSLGEVVQGGGLLVDPYDAGEIAQAMAALATEKNTRAMLRERGLERVKDFTWEKSAERAERLFTSLAKGLS